MGNIISKSKVDVDLRNSQESSCNLTEYWNEKQHDFHNKFTNSKSPLKLVAQPSDFNISTLLDEGSFGSVVLTTHNRTGATYATKIIAKKKIVNKNLVSFCKKPN